MAEYSILEWKSPDGVEFYGYHGTAASPKAVVALVHGIGEHSDRYKHMADYFIEKGFAFAAYDQRGHGKSSGKRGHTPSYNTLADDLDTFLTKVRAFYPGIPVFLYGHSMGGNVVLNYFVNGRAKNLAGIITSGAFIKLAFEPSAFMVALGRFMRNLLPGFTQNNQLAVEHISRSPQVVEAYKNDPLVHNKLSATMGIGMIETAKKLYNYQGRSDIPLLLMHGGADKITSKAGTKRFAENVTGDVTYKEWPGLFHELHNEPEQKEVFNFVIDWINQHL